MHAPHDSRQHPVGRHAAPLPAPSVVRAFTLTRGRTTPQVALPFEARLSVSAGSPDRSSLQGPAAQALDVCDGLSVAEVAARLQLPVGVVRVILADLVVSGHVSVQRTLADAAFDERRDLLQRTLRGLLVS